MQEVAVDESGLLYHDPQVIATTCGTSKMSLSDARESDANPCSHCFTNELVLDEWIILG